MGKSVADAVLDASLNYLKNNVTKLVVCTSEPTTYSEATAGLSSSGFALADVVVNSADFTVGAGVVSGRKVQVGAQTSVSIDSTGTAGHIALVVTGSSAALLYVTTCTALALTSGSKVNTPAFNIELRDPS